MKFSKFYFLCMFHFVLAFAIAGNMFATAVDAVDTLAFDLGHESVARDTADTVQAEYPMQIQRRAARIVIREKGVRLTPADREKIRSAFVDALDMARSVKTEMDRIWNQPGRVRKRRKRRRAAWTAHTNFVRWYGGSTKMTLMRRVQRRINKLEKWLSRARIVVKAHAANRRRCTDHTNAFSAVPRRPVIVHLCPRWFGESSSRRAAIVIHELVHQLGFGHPNDAVTSALALALAKKSSRKARRSPENYEHLYELYF